MSNRNRKISPEEKGIVLHVPEVCNLSVLQFCAYEAFGQMILYGLWGFQNIWGTLQDGPGQKAQGCNCTR